MVVRPRGCAMKTGFKEGATVFIEAKGTLYPNKPLYMQLRDIFADLIDSGELVPGDVLPGERKLAEMYDISRVTVRKCIGYLVDEGYVAKSQGKETRIIKRNDSKSYV